MSAKNDEYNRAEPQRQGPESSLRDGGCVGAGNLVTMHQARQGGGSDSFPVLQAFQEYIDAERKQARKRVIQLSIGFAVILGVVVVGFLAAGVSILRNTTNMQTKLMEIVAAKSSTPVQRPPAVAQPVQRTSPALEESIREMSRALAKMRQESNDRAETAARAAKKTPAVAPPAVDPALEALRAEIASMKEQSRKMEGELVTLREKKSGVAEQSPGSSRVVAEALARARKTSAEKAAADKAALEAAAVAMAKKRAREEEARQAQVEAEKTIAAEIAAKRAEAERAAAPRSVEQPLVEKSDAAVKKEKTSADIPVATKAPPVAPVDIKAPKPPKNMEGRLIALKTNDGSVVPWRIFIPE